MSDRSDVTNEILSPRFSEFSNLPVESTRGIPFTAFVADGVRVIVHETPAAGSDAFNITGNYVISVISVISRKHYANIFSVNAFNLNNKLYFNHISFIKEFSPDIGRGVRASYTIRFFYGIVGDLMSSFPRRIYAQLVAVDGRVADGNHAFQLSF